MIIIFDTETNGLPKNWNAPTSDIENWPRLVQIAWQQFSDDGRKIAEHCYVVKPEGFEIPKEVSDINRITTERAHAEGLPLAYVMLTLWQAMLITDKLVAHNIAFDEKIIGAEFIRLGMQEAHDLVFRKDRICTMKETTTFCGIPGPRGMKWPKLSELHQTLFGTGFEGAHDALVDVAALSKCFFELKKRGIICA